MIGACVLLGLVTIERLGELWLANRNTKALLQQGAVEFSPAHYPLIVALHSAWLAGLWYLAWDKPLNLTWLGVFLLLQVLRFWVLATLKGRWTTRIIVIPNASLVTAGPYRFLSHPNYVVVVGEIVVLPLVFGLGWFALLFLVLKAAILFVRITAENTALGRVSHG